ncbi:hypothetical protein TIFTF001_044133 [Ficus carica]|uniref:Uncharacterized protein n=1 Tax=Ficus carica TaxID=3494 RepID=A0AA87Z0G6_FICCA|nr:hypothetical protein TIFTF001_044128 [Ficus carica]GMN27538.1 hypothetical protein TIFTF001_044133 [Ficus carica]
MDKQKEVIDDVDVEWTSTDSSDSSSDNEELMSTIRRSRFEHEFQHSQMGAGTSNEASERSRPATTSGEDLLSIPPVARLTEPPRVDMVFRTRSNFVCHSRVSERIPFPKDGSVFDAEWDEGFLGIDCAVRRSEHRAISRRCARDILSSRKFERSWTVLDVPAEEEASSWRDEERRQILAGSLLLHACKELKKPPPKALLFEEKLERLLALPSREWDDIQVPKRLRASSLWKDFVELPSGIPKRVPSWPSSPPVKKRKVVEKPKRKVPAKRNKKLKVPIPETDVEGPRVKVDLPPRVSILQDRQTSVDIARQLFSDADAEIMKQGPPQSHMDDIMWETMKINVRTMGLFYRMSDKVAEQRDRLKDLVEKDIARGEKLLDIERKFGDVKAGAEGLMFELQKSMDVAREGTSAMETLVKRFDEAQAKIKSLEVENAALATQIMDAFENATFKARYDILKDYKAGLLDKA